MIQKCETLVKKNDVRQEIFFLDRFCYQESILFTGKIKDIIKAHFFQPEIYKIEDFYLAFNNNRTSRSEHLPAIPFVFFVVEYFDFSELNLRKL